MDYQISKCFNYKVVLSDDGCHCMVIDPDGVVRGENLTIQQALDLRYKLYEKDVDAFFNRFVDRGCGVRQLSLNF